MGFFRNYLPFRWRKISGFFDSLEAPAGVTGGSFSFFLINSHIPCRLRIRRQLTKPYRSPARKAAKHTATDRYAGSSAAAMLHRLSPPPPP